MSIALELWRVLEAWDAARHPRGPGGKFVTLGGGKERPSLADVVRGTAAGGPKRQRTDKGGMSVADAVRHAARTSDTTGRPTQRSAAEHRAHGAHSVADEVDRALVDSGASDDVRQAVSGRARLVADSHGPRPDSLTKPDKKMGKLSDERLGQGLEMHGTETPTGRKVVAEMARRELARRQAAQTPDLKASTAEVKTDIHSAVRDLRNNPDDWVGLADLREQLGDKHSRADVDKALHDLLDEPGVRIIPVANTKALRPRDRAAAVQIGGEDNHVIKITADVGTAPRHTGYDSMDSREVDSILGDAGIDTSGMTRDQKLAALAARDQRIGVARFGLGEGGTARTPDTPRSLAIDRTEISGWKSRPAAPAKTHRTGKALGAERLSDITQRLKTMASRDGARDQLKGLTAPQLRELAAHAGVTVGSKYTKPRLVDALVDALAGRRLDAAAIARL